MAVARWGRLGKRRGCRVALLANGAHRRASAPLRRAPRATTGGALGAKLGARRLCMACRRIIPWRHQAQRLSGVTHHVFGRGPFLASTSGMLVEGEGHIVGALSQEGWRGRGQLGIVHRCSPMQELWLSIFRRCSVLKQPYCVRRHVSGMLKLDTVRRCSATRCLNTGHRCGVSLRRVRGHVSGAQRLDTRHGCSLTPSKCTGHRCHAW